jgi:hypothetical protein
MDNVAHAIWNKNPDSSKNVNVACRNFTLIRPPKKGYLVNFNIYKENFDLEALFALTIEAEILCEAKIARKDCFGCTTMQIIQVIWVNCVFGEFGLKDV